MKNGRVALDASTDSKNVPQAIRHILSGQDDVIEGILDRLRNINERLTERTG